MHEVNRYENETFETVEKNLYQRLHSASSICRTPCGACHCSFQDHGF